MMDLGAVTTSCFYHTCQNTKLMESTSMITVAPLTKMSSQTGDNKIAVSSVQGLRAEVAFIFLLHSRHAATFRHAIPTVRCE